MGWPEDTEDLRSFYPTSVNSTDRGIINLWVTRMIFSGLFFMGAVPFQDVIIHATIQAPDGRRMSKSLGTGIDPRVVIARYGADALRAWAALVGMSSQDVRFDEVLQDSEKIRRQVVRERDGRKATHRNVVVSQLRNAQVLPGPS